jgi:bla regulator protein blaR1
MIPSATAALNHISWAAVGKPLANHLWQSTLFAGVVALLTLALSKNSPRVRYALWFSTSVKFLIPFSLLIGIGSRLAQPRSPAARGFSLVMQEISEPFAPTIRAIAPALSPHGLAAASSLVTAFLFAAWLCGCATVLFLWWLQWRRVVAAVREGQVATPGREFQVFERLKRDRAIAGVALVISKSALEPGIVGILRPIMLLPAGISDRLTDAQLKAILTHELCHVRRRDNLAAAVHMLVETIFWFYPLVWWIGARLLNDRERACDEEVLKLGNEPHAYAEGILQVCEFYLESPLVCVSGVTGSNLEKRIEAIMIHRAARKLDLGRKLLLAIAGVTAIVGPLVMGLLNPVSSRAQSQAATPATSPIETVSIKPSASSANFISVRRTANATGPSEFTAAGINLAQLLAAAYDMNSNFQVSGGPAWVHSAKYDVSIKDPAGDRAMPDLQNALADRFKLTFHRETSELPGYDLVVGSGGPKLTEVPAGSVTPEKSRMFSAPPGHMIATQVTMEEFARALSSQTACPVVDKTGLTGVYDFALDWTMTPPQPDQSGTAFPAPSPESVRSLLKAVPEQLGLELTPQTAAVEMLIIDNAEQVTGEE